MQRDSLFSSLMWQMSIGAEAVVEVFPTNWLSSHPSPQPVASPQPIASPQPVASPHVSTVPSLSTVESLRQAMLSFHDSPLYNPALKFVFATGDPYASVMIIGDAPEQEDELQGIPFAGKNGILLSYMLRAIGLQKHQVYMTYVVPWKPPVNRLISLQEALIFRNFIVRHIELIAPQILLLLGTIPTQILLNQKTSTLQQKSFPYHSPGLKHPLIAIPTLHPSLLLNAPNKKKQAWTDLLILKETLSKLNSLN